MRKYLTLFTLTWQNGLVYRLSVFFWRLRQFLGTLMSLTLWSVIFANKDQVLAYKGPEMITYIFLVGALQSLILATVLNGLAGQVHAGNLSHELVKPVNIYVYLGIQDLADKLKNFLFLLIEIGILYLMFRPEIVLPTLSTWPLFILWVMGGVILNFLLSLLFGALGFWTPETWGPRFLFFMFLDFTAGRLFPLDILPKVIQQVLFFTPFPYFSFIQTQLFLGKLSPDQQLHHTLVLAGWVIGLGLLVKGVWSRGLRDYGAAGR